MKVFIKYFSETINNNKFKYKDILKLKNFKINFITYQIVLYTANKLISKLNKEDINIFMCEQTNAIDIQDNIKFFFNIDNKQINVYNKIIDKYIYKSIIDTQLKYDFIFISFFYSTFELIECNNINTIWNLLQIILILNIQKLNGHSFLYCYINMDIVNIQLLYIMSKYYKSILIVNTEKIFNGFLFCIKFVDFIGINEIELQKLNKIATYIFDNFNNFKDKCYSVNSIIKVKSKSFNKFKYKIYNIIKNEIIKLEKYLIIRKKIGIINNDDSLNSKYKIQLYHIINNFILIEYFNKIYIKTANKSNTNHSI
jgi:hypothetical protein